MRFLLRLFATLILAPLVWRLGIAYIASQQGTTWSDLAQQSIAILTAIYITFTLPALVLCLALAIADWALHKLGLDLLTVVVSPGLAWLITLAVIHWVQDPRVQSAEGAVVLSVFYGLVWGLTIREPRRRRRPARPLAIRGEAGPIGAPGTGA